MPRHTKSGPGDTMTMATLLAVAWFVIGQAASQPVHEQAWLKTFEGNWVPEESSASGNEVVLTITREKTVLVLRTVVGSRELQTRYDLSGADIINAGMGQSAVFRSRIEDRRIITEIWDGSEAKGPPARIETRFLESPNRMVGELRRTPDGPVFNRGVLRRK